ARDNMLKKNMGLTFIGAHLATLEWSVDRIAAFLDAFPNASVDLAERVCHLQDQSQKDRTKVRDFIIKYQDRILYGTDFQQLEEITPNELKVYMNKVWMNDWKYFNTDEMMTVPQLNSEFQGLKLPKIVVDKIYRLNAEKIFPNAWD
ncbi:MAG: amidohydrolase family protein, partial [Cyclobacteriaceae bacterium]|nr:amidohydrolase family protein [Cyclobacteriaceae bacterium]